MSRLQRGYSVAEPSQHMRIRFHAHRASVSFIQVRAAPLEGGNAEVAAAAAKFSKDALAAAVVAVSWNTTAWGPGPGERLPRRTRRWRRVPSPPRRPRCRSTCLRLLPQSGAQGARPRATGRRARRAWPGPREGCRTRRGFRGGKWAGGSRRSPPASRFREEGGDGGKSAVGQAHKVAWSMAVAH